MYGVLRATDSLSDFRAKSKSNVGNQSKNEYTQSDDFQQLHNYRVRITPYPLSNMPTSCHNRTVTQHTPAKINLSLEVLGKRTDGYHELATMMASIRLYDTLTLERSEKATTLTVLNGDLSSRGLTKESVPFQDIPVNDENLVIRALKLLLTHAGINQGTNVRLVKRIPSQAGLGGGSSDAAAALIAGNRLFMLGYKTEELATLGAQLGSDIPFFVHTLGGIDSSCGSKPGLALCQGRGEQIHPLSVRPSMPCVVIKPNYGMSTPEVYRAVKKQDFSDNGSNSNALRDLLVNNNWRRIGPWMTNSLQSAALRVYPDIQKTIDTLKRIPVLCHQLSGSGSAYFAICRTIKEARRTASILRAKNLGTVYVTNTC